mmetsp:Transcript_4734/g.11265  ORF Transcript_4734/g.11265 Transcript_4734/m.11265 type:complete len:101 (-) Transcript_4734:59-361(-)
MHVRACRGRASRVKSHDEQPKQEEEDEEEGAVCKDAPRAGQVVQDVMPRPKQLVGGIIIFSLRLYSCKEWSTVTGPRNQKSKCSPVMERREQLVKNRCRE